ncbi:cryptochrome/photolyase family protein [Neptunicella marina]|uniref:Cryptochrome/photolyase family protein n=1 Tax=Neptunicella marina TaxID=2125989 RepID=A0A8J6M0X0_9ALTE|nr:cryptochrome/photolyase family protein [Neptunicella marina]MBC3767795.1 cryptochrome/photolyase family protein [Neptunicella marina]
MTVLRVVLGDQLSESISSLKDADKANDIILMAEVWDEATYVKHHKKKIAFLFSAMRHFAKELTQAGYRVHYTHFDDHNNRGSLRGEVEGCCELYNINKVVVTHPGEYRVLQDIQQWQQVLKLDVEIKDDLRFLCSQQEFARWAKQRSSLRMEYFYRDMRKKYFILMEGEQPVGGKWNYDAENRQPPKRDLFMPQPCITPLDPTTQDVIQLVAERFPNHFGDLMPFHFAVTREQALQVLQQFIEQRLCLFGDYQDAMLEGEPWMYHSHISFYLNCGLLQPMECIRAAEQAYYNREAPLNSVEGFIRQILGWREYVRGIYWLKMPEYAQQNFFNANRKLPQFYWDADTKMNCMRQCISDTKQNAYAHHIQRLMVLGNFALLAGLSPEQVNNWYLLVYADAYEWVELPNVTGMILFADGGYLASKPYAAGGSYINKMSDYCQHCDYKVTVKNGKSACPFNYLYWDFLARNRGKLASNHRLGMMYKTYDRMSDDKKREIELDAERFLNELR